MSTVDKVGNRKNYINLAQLYTAIRRKERKKFIECIVKNQDDINYKVPVTDFLQLRRSELIGNTALHLAFGESNYEIFNLLLDDYHADFNVQNNNEKKMNLVQRAVVENFNNREIWKLRQRFNDYDRVFTLDDVNGFVMMQRVIEENDNFKIYVNWRLWGKFEDRYIRTILSALVEMKNFIELPVNDGLLSHFHAACLTNDLRAVDYFLKRKVDVNKSSSIFYEYTPLHLAVKYSNLEIVELLLATNEVNLSAKDTKCMTALDILLDQNMKIIEWLLAKKKMPYKNAIVDYVENEKKMNAIVTKFMVTDDPTSCFHAVCALSSINACFLQANYDCISTSNLWPGYTALHFASFFNIETVKILLNSGADIEAKDANGITPLDILVTRVTIDDLYFIVCHQVSWKCIILSDGKTKLTDLILAMKDSCTFYNFMNHIGVNSHIPFDSPLWPGYTILHLAVSFSETTKRVTFLRNIFNTNRNNVSLEYENCCQEQVSNYLERIEVCLDKNADVTVKDKRGWTPLNLAFRQRQMEAVHLMLQNYNKTCNPIDDDNLSHLHIACSAKDNILVEKLISNGADVNVAIKSTFEWQCDYYHCTSTDVFDITGSTSLHLSVSIEDLDLVKILLRNGADVNAKDSMGLSSIHRIFIQQHLWAVGNELFKVPKVVTYILRRGRRSGIPTYSKAMNIGNSISDELLSSPNLQESVVDNFGLSHLHVAVCKNNVEVTEKLLALGSDINSTIKCIRKKLATNHPLYLLSRYDNWTPLHFARDEKLDGILVKHGADILAKRADGTNKFFDKLQHSYVENNGFFVAALKENEDLRERLNDQFGWTILHVACQIVNLELANFAFECGVDVNSRTHDDSPIHSGSTALHTLMSNGNKIDQQSDEIITSDYERIFRSLLGNAADVMINDTHGNTPLHRSNSIPGCLGNSYARSIYAARLLEQVIIEDVTINPINHQGISVFHIACLGHDARVMKKFLERGVDVNQPVEFFSDNLAGCTPLHLAARYRSGSLGDVELQLRSVELLLMLGADVQAVNAFGDTPLHSAAQCDSPRYVVIEKIVEYGADVNVANVYGKTPLELLLSSSQLSRREIEFFLNRGCRMNSFNDITQAGYIPLLYRFEQKSMEDYTLKAALHCPSIREVDCMGRTALHNVVSIPNYPNNDDIDVIEYLVNYCGCDIDRQDTSGKTALHLAVQFRNSDAVEGLLMHDCDVNIVDANGKTAYAYSLEVESLCDLIDVGGHNHHLVVQILTRYIYHFTRQTLHLHDVNNQTLTRAFNDFAIDRNQMHEDYMKLNLARLSDVYKLGDFLSETKAIVFYSRIDRENREDIERFFTIDIEEHRFHEWKFLCKSQYNKALHRAELIENAKDAMNVVMGFPLPDLCFDVIEKFLSNKDLKRLTVAATR